MKKLLLIAVVAGGLMVAGTTRSDAQVYVSIGFGPGYYGYYPYGSYYPYRYYARPYYRSYYRPYYRYGGHRYYRNHHRHPDYYRYCFDRNTHTGLARSYFEPA